MKKGEKCYWKEDREGKHNRKLIKESRKRMLVEEKNTKKWLSKTKVKQIYTAEEMKAKHCKKNIKE